MIVVTDEHSRATDLHASSEHTSGVALQPMMLHILRPLRRRRLRPLLLLSLQLPVSLMPETADNQSCPTSASRYRR